MHSKKEKSFPTRPEIAKTYYYDCTNAGAKELCGHNSTLPTHPRSVQKSAYEEIRYSLLWTGLITSGLVAYRIAISHTFGNEEILLTLFSLASFGVITICIVPDKIQEKKQKEAELIWDAHSMEHQKRNVY